MKEIKSNKAATVVQEIGDVIIDRLNELDDNYEYECDEFGFDSASVRIGSIVYLFGNAECEIEASVWWSSKKGASIECLLYGAKGIHDECKKLERIEELVQEYVDENLDTDALLDAISESVENSYYDEWNEHGFRDAADYYHWRYGG